MASNITDEGRQNHKRRSNSESISQETAKKRKHEKDLEIHYNMLAELSGIIYPESDVYKRALIRSRPYLNPKEIAMCKNDTGVLFDVLESRGRLRLGNYDVLENIIDDERARMIIRKCKENVKQGENTAKKVDELENDTFIPIRAVVYGEAVLKKSAITEASNNNIDTVKELPRQRTKDVSIQDEFGDTVLHDYAKKGSLKEFKTYLTRKSMSRDLFDLLSLRDKDNLTVVMSAAVHKQKHIFKFLLEDILINIRKPNLTCNVDQTENNLLYYCFLNDWTKLILPAFRLLYIPGFRFCTLSKVNRLQDLKKIMTRKGQNIIMWSFGHRLSTVNLSVCTLSGSNTILSKNDHGWNIQYWKILEKLVQNSGKPILYRDFKDKEVLLLFKPTKVKQLIDGIKEILEETTKEYNWDSILHAFSIFDMVRMDGLDINDVLRVFPVDKILNYKDSSGQTPLLKAGGLKRREMVMDLLKYTNKDDTRKNRMDVPSDLDEIGMKCKELDLMISDETGCNILHHCAENGWPDIFHEILGHVSDSTERYKMLNAQGGYNKQTVILKAAESENKVIVESLIKSKEVDIKCISKDGFNILHYCALNGWNDVLCDVLGKLTSNTDRESMLNTKLRYSKRTVVLQAAESKNKGVVEEIIKYKDVNLKCIDIYGCNILHYCAENGWTKILCNVLGNVTDSTDRHKMLNTKGRYCQRSVILQAAMSNNKKVVKELIGYEEIDMKSIDIYGCNILHYCAANGWTEILCKVLENINDNLERTAMLNTKGSYKRTVILQAAKSQHVGVVENLIKCKGVDMKCTDEEECNILHHCIKNGWTAILFDLLRHMKNNTDRHTMKNVLNTKGPNNRSVLLLAAQSKNKNIVEELMKYKEVDIKCTDIYGCNILHYCAENDWAGISRKVLRIVTDSMERGAMLNAKGLYRRTVILQAAESKNKEVVEELLKFKEVDKNCTDSSGYNIVKYCAKNGWNDIFIK